MTPESVKALLIVALAGVAVGLAAADLTEDAHKVEVRVTQFLLLAFGIVAVMVASCASAPPPPHERDPFRYRCPALPPLCSDPHREACPCRRPAAEEGDPPRPIPVVRGDL